RKGESHPLTERNLLPGDFEAITGNPSQWGLAIALMAFGAMLILGLEFWGRKLSQQKTQGDLPLKQPTGLER
ncbi:MAG: hypothetical protein ACKOHH_06220, partial [Bacteroidota bacterium]